MHYTLSYTIASVQGKQKTPKLTVVSVVVVTVDEALDAIIKRSPLQYSKSILKKKRKVEN